MRSFEEICRVIEHRRNAQSPLIRQMLEVQRRYHADYVIPIPDMDDQPELPPLTPALVAQAIDAPALDAAQVRPDIFCPPLDHTKATGVKSRERSRKREHAIKSTHYKSKMQLQMYRFFRHLSGYATASMLVRPSYAVGFPMIEIRNPLSTFAEPKAAEDVSRVGNVGYIHARSSDWLRNRFPLTRVEHGGPIGIASSGEEELWDVIEWWDDEQITWGLLGPQHGYHSSAENGYLRASSSPTFQLLHQPNKIGHCPAVVGSRITLDKIATQVAQNTGIIDFMGRLLMLDMIAAERNVFPDRYMVGERGDMPRITTANGNWRDGRTGDINILEGVRSVGEMRSQPDPMTRAAYDTLERNFKVSTGVTGVSMGENSSNLRTGRAIAEIYGVSVDPRVMELQRIAEFALAEVNESVLATWEACWPDDKVMLFAGFAGNRAVDEFKPKRDVEGSHDNAVSYTIAGADVQQTTVALGQLFGTDAISLDSFRRRHPWVDDPDTEGQRVNAERIERAMFDSVLMRAQSGELPLSYLAKIGKLIAEGTDIADAIEEADTELKAMQATPPEQSMGPEAMPGLEAAGVGGPALAALGAGPAPNDPAMAEQAPTVGPTANQVGLSDLLGAMRGGGMG